MTLQQYLANKQEREKLGRLTRAACSRCKKPTPTCYCAAVKPFHSSPQFVILIHGKEVKRSIATGRMAHLCLTNSLFIQGTDFSQNSQVNALLADPKNHCVLLSPGSNSLNLSILSSDQRNKLFPPNKSLIVFVVDGTWAQARRMKRLSRNLGSLPSICFTPKTPSQFRVRKQPEAYCYSTIEAIHECIALTDLDNTQPRENLLRAFSFMVNQQIDYENKMGSWRGFRSVRGQRIRTYQVVGE